jgi:O-antigen ligase
MPSNDRLNRRYMMLLYGALGIGGSLYSVLVAGAGVFASIKFLAERRRAPLAPEVMMMALAGLAYYASGLLIIATNASDQGNYWLAVERLLFLGFVPLFLQISLSDGRAVRDSLEFGAAIGAAGIAAWALGEWVYSEFVILGFRAYGAPGNPGPYATTAAALMSICLLAAARPDQTKRPWFAAASLCAAFGLMMSGLRTLFPAVIIIPAIVLMAWPQAVNGFMKRTSLWVVLGVAIALVTASGLIISYRMTHLVSMIGWSGLSPTAANSLGERIALWYCAADAFREAPLFGLGRSDAYRYMHECTSALIGEPLEYSHFHNALATAAAFGGLVDVCATSALLLVPLYWCWRHRRDPDSRYGVILILSILTIYGLNGVTNLMLGHDIHDALFVHLMTVAFVLMVARRPATAR